MSLRKFESGRINNTILLLEEHDLKTCSLFFSKLVSFRQPLKFPKQFEPLACFVPGSWRGAPPYSLPPVVAVDEEKKSIFNYNFSYITFSEKCLSSSRRY